MTIAYPRQIHTHGRWVTLKEATESEVVAFIQEQAFNALMSGKPFGTIIADAAKYAMWWQAPAPSNLPTPIEKLQAEIWRLQEALERIIKCHEPAGQTWQEESEAMIRIAQEALNGQKFIVRE